MSNIQTTKQKYNDLKDLVTRSYADETERNEIWEYISSYILSPDKSQIQEERLEDFTIFLGHEGRLAHTDIIVNALEPTICDEKKCKALSFAFNRVHRNLWGSFCYGESVGTSQELTRFFYIETEE